MSFLGATCIDHGQASTSPSDVCCSGYNPWAYDANTGQAYSGFMCWSATCAAEGQWAGPNGVGDHCCSGLTNVGGKCAVSNAGSGDTGGGSGGTPLCQGTLICSIPDMYLYIGLGLIAVVALMGGKKK